jgi:methionine biosynthesis protein MetW
VPEGARVLDIGCSDGALLAWLRDCRQVDGRGIEIDPDRVAAAVARGLSVVQGDAEQVLGDFPDHAVDVVILSETLQAMHRPARVLSEMLRVGERALVAFPNFGHWRVRLALLAGGRMPTTASLPARWHETENIHLCTVADFRALAAELDMVILGEQHLAGQRSVPARSANWRADHALFMLARR